MWSGDSGRLNDSTLAPTWVIPALLPERSVRLGLRSVESPKRRVRAQPYPALVPPRLRRPQRRVATVSSQAQVEPSRIRNGERPALNRRGALVASGPFLSSVIHIRPVPGLLSGNV